MVLPDDGAQRGAAKSSAARDRIFRAANLKKSPFFRPFSATPLCFLGCLGVCFGAGLAGFLSSIHRCALPPGRLPGAPCAFALVPQGPGRARCQGRTVRVRQKIGEVITFRSQHLLLARWAPVFSRPPPPRPLAGGDLSTLACVNPSPDALVKPAHAVKARTVSEQRF